MSGTHSAKLPTWDEPCVRLENGSYVWATREWLEGTYGEQGETEREAERNELVCRITAAVVAALGERAQLRPAPAQSDSAADREALIALLDECGFELDES